MAEMGSTRISWMRLSLSSPSTGTIRQFQSANCSGLTLVLVETKNRFFVAIMELSRMFPNSASIYTCGSLQIAT